MMIWRTGFNKVPIWSQRGIFSMGVANPERMTDGIMKTCNGGCSCRKCLMFNVKWDLQVMLRLARLDAPGVLHYVMGRGIERKKIFLSDMDRNDFIGRLSALGQDGAMAVILPIASIAA